VEVVVVTISSPVCPAPVREVDRLVLLPSVKTRIERRFAAPEILRFGSPPRWGLHLTRRQRWCATSANPQPQGSGWPPYLPARDLRPIACRCADLGLIGVQPARAVVAFSREPHLIPPENAVSA